MGIGVGVPVTPIGDSVLWRPWRRGIVSIDLSAEPVVVDGPEVGPVVVMYSRQFSEREALTSADQLGWKDAVPQRIAGEIVAEARRIGNGASAVILPSAVFASRLDRAMACLNVGAIGVPVVLDVSEDLVEHLGRRTLGILRDPPRCDWDPMAMDRQGVELRRSILIEHAFPTLDSKREAEAASRVPCVLVVAPVRDQREADRVVETVAQQTYQSKTVLLVPQENSIVFDSDRVPVAVAAGPEAHQVDYAVGGSGCDLISLWDPAHLYSNDHLWDMVLAVETSGECGAGKAAEFRYLTELDITVQDNPDGRYRRSPEVEAGTLTFRHHSWPGWDVLRTTAHLGGNLVTLGEAGGEVYRTHGYGLLVNDPAIAGALARSVRQWPGRAAAEAGVESGSARATRRLQ